MNQYSRIIRTIFVTGLAFLVNFLITLFLVPYITGMVGTEAYGWVKVAKDAINYGTMMMLVIQEFSTRFIGVHYYKGEYDKANVYFSSAFFGDIGLGMLLFTAAMIVTANIDSVFQISPGLVSDVQILFLFTMLKFLQLTLLAVFECGPVIADRMNVTGRFRLISYLAEAGMLLLLFHLFQPKVYLVGLALLLSSVLTTLPNIVICRRYIPELKIKACNFSFRAVGRLVGNGIWSSLNALSNFLNSGCDLMITNIMLSALQMGQIAIVQSISAIITSLFAIVSPAFQPMILKCYSHNEHDDMMKWFYLSMKACGCLCSLFFVGFFLLGHLFYELWIPGQDIDLLYRLTVIAIIPALSGGLISPFFYAYTLTVKKMVPFFYAMAGGIINVTSMIILLRFTDMGLMAVVITTAVTMLTDNLVANALYSCHVLGEPVKRFYANVARCLLAAAVMAGVLFVIDMLIDPSGLVMFIVCALLYSVTGVLIYGLVVLGKEERARLMQLVTNR